MFSGPGMIPDKWICLLSSLSITFSARCASAANRNVHLTSFSSGWAEPPLKFLHFGSEEWKDPDPGKEAALLGLSGGKSRSWAGRMCRCCRWVTGRGNAFLFGSDSVSGSVVFGGVGRFGRSHFSERHAAFRGTRRAERPTAAAEVPSFPASDQQGAVRSGRKRRWSCATAPSGGRTANNNPTFLDFSQQICAGAAETSNYS